MFRKHRHSYKLHHVHHHPHGYLFRCARCVAEGLDPFKFIRVDQFWGAR